jgi:hypothetical protein
MNSSKKLNQSTVNYPKRRNRRPDKMTSTLGFMQGHSKKSEKRSSNKKNRQSFKQEIGKKY